MASLLSRPRQMIAYGLQRFEVGQTFRDLPAHLTFMTWFRGADQKTLDSYLATAVNSQSTFPIRLGTVLETPQVKDLGIRAKHPIYPVIPPAEAKAINGHLGTVMALITEGFRKLTVDRVYDFKIDNSRA